MKHLPPIHRYSVMATIFRCGPKRVIVPAKKEPPTLWHRALGTGHTTQVSIGNVNEATLISDIFINLQNIVTTSGHGVVAYILWMNDPRWEPKTFLLNCPKSRFSKKPIFKNWTILSIWIFFLMCFSIFGFPLPLRAWLMSWGSEMPIEKGGVVHFQKLTTTSPADIASCLLKLLLNYSRYSLVLMKNLIHYNQYCFP